MGTHPVNAGQDCLGSTTFTCEAWHKLWHQSKHWVKPTWKIALKNIYIYRKRGNKHCCLFSLLLSLKWTQCCWFVAVQRAQWGHLLWESVPWTSSITADFRVKENFHGNPQDSYATEKLHQRWRIIANKYPIIMYHRKYKVNRSSV